MWIEHVTCDESYMNYLMRYPSIAIISQPVTQKYSIPIPTIVLHLPPTKIFRLKHRLIIIQIEHTQDVVFSRFRGFSFTVILRQKPRVVRTGSLSLCLVIQGYCEWITSKSWKNDIYCSICIVINLWIKGTDVAIFENRNKFQRFKHFPSNLNKIGLSFWLFVL